MVNGPWGGLVSRAALTARRSRSGRGVWQEGPAGSVGQHRLESKDFACCVIGPALIPFRPGYRVKADRRDAHLLA